MIRGQVTLRAAALLAGLALVGGGCAARRDYRSGQAEARNGNWDMAVARLTRALQRRPDDIGIKVALESARIQASRQHADLARKHMAASDLEKAADELDIASKYDSSNKSVADDLVIVRARIQKRTDEHDRLASFDETKARAATRPVVPVLSPRSPKPILLKWNDQSLQKLVETLGKLAGVNMLFDEGFRDKNVTVNLNGVTFQEALDQITFINRMFYKVVDQNTIIIVPDSSAKRRTYDEWVLRTFYIQNAEIKDVETIVKNALGAGPKVNSNPTLNALTVIGTPDHLALASRIIELNDKARGEVVIEVQVMEIDRNKARDYGIALSNYGLSATFAPTADPDAANASTTTNVRAHMLSSLNLADFIVSVPASIVSRFFQNASTGKIIAAPRLRAAEGKKTTVKIGQQIPVPTTTFTAANTGGGGTFSPATSFSYRDVGVTLDITPKVNASGDITLETAAEFSLLGDRVEVPGAGPVLSFLTRQVTGLVRVRDGETVLIGGLLQDEEQDSLAGILGLQKIPILNSIFSTRSKTMHSTEVVISMTTHLVRAPKITEEDLVGWNVGTQELVKVQGARPPLFGATPEEVAAPASSSAPGSAPGAPASSTPPAAAPATIGVMPPSGAGSTLPGAAPTVGSLTGPTDDVSASAAAGAPLTMSAAGSGAVGAPETAAPAAGPATAVRASLTPPVATVRNGDTTSIGVVVMGGQDMTAAEVILSYDPTALSPLDAVPGPLFTLDGAPVGTEKNLEPARSRARFTRTSPAAGSGVVATFTFRTLRQGLATVKVEALALSTSAGTVTPTLAGPAQVNVE